jgi:hypothetical protein
MQKSVHFLVLVTCGISIYRYIGISIYRYINIVNRLKAGRPTNLGFDTRQQQEIFLFSKLSRQRSGTHRTSQSVGTVLFPWAQSDRRVKVTQTIHLRLVPRLEVWFTLYTLMCLRVLQRKQLFVI